MTDVNARRSDADMPGAAPADQSGQPPTVTPPARVPSSVRIPPRPSAPPTSAIPVVAASTAPDRESPTATAATPESPAAAPTAAAAAPTAAAQEPHPGLTPSTPEARGRQAAAPRLGEMLSDRAAQLTGQLKGRLKRARAGTRTGAGGNTMVAAVQRLGVAKIAAGLAAVAVLGLLIWWLTSLGAAKQDSAESSRTPAAGGVSASPTARGPLPLEGVGPLDFRLGDCFKDFDANAATSTVVACDSGHSAQLVAVESYGASDSYPGRDPLKQRALDACKAATLTEKSSEYVLNYKLAYPSSSSWGTGDRRVDCYVAADAGNVIKESLLP